MKEAQAFLLQDPVLRPLIESIDISQHSSTHTPFTSLSRSIISQQLSVKAADSILARCEIHFAKEFEPEELLKTPIAILRTLGLSARKASYWHNIAEHKLANQQFWQDIQQFSDQDVIEQLIQIKGVGLWTIQMLLMFNLKREDIFPIGDLAVRDAMARLYKIDLPKKELYPKLESIAKKWSPHRTLASRYLWTWRSLQR
jgi:DNA-3-methyladenine glycosylase II